MLNWPKEMNAVSTKALLILINEKFIITRSWKSVVVCMYENHPIWEPGKLLRINFLITGPILTSPKNICSLENRSGSHNIMRGPKLVGSPQQKVRTAQHGYQHWLSHWPDVSITLHFLDEKCHSHSLSLCGWGEGIFDSHYSWLLCLGNRRKASWAPFYSFLQVGSKHNLPT